MSEVTITTNNVPRDVVEAYELTAAEREEFDYLDWTKLDAGEDSASFFRYRGELYDLGEFMRWESGNDHPFSRWDGYQSETFFYGYQSETFFSGLLVRYVDNFERVVVARYCC